MTNQTEAIVGKHGFDGACRPGGQGEFKFTTQNSFSLGIFEWMKSKSEQPKRGKVKVRVVANMHDYDAACAKARQIAAMLDTGTYSGPKTVRVQPDDKS